MRHAKPPLRPGMTAIAAVLAFSSTPLLAQTVDAAPVPPTIVTPPPVVTPAPSLSEAPVPANAAVSKAPAPVSVNLEADTSAEPAAHAIPAQAAAARVQQAAPRAAARPRVAEAAPRALSTTAPAAPPLSPPVTVAQPAPIVETAAPVAPARSPAQATDELLPIAGAGAAVLLLAGGAFALNRRRRRAEDEIYVADTPVEPAMAPVVNPAAPMAYATPPVEAHRSGDAPVTAVPAGFDMSRFGRHTQAAYRGPTADNPSLSLRRRLKRASFFDQRERMAAQPGTPKQTSSFIPASNAAPAAASRQTDHVTTRVNRPRPNFRPAYQG